MAAPRMPHAAVCIGTAPPVDVAEVEVEVEVEEEAEEPWAWPSAVDSLAFRVAAAPVKATASTLVLFEQDEGFS